MISRKIYSKLVAQKDDKKISLLLGPRQVGKTTLLKTLKDDLSKTNICLFLDLDILSAYEKVSNYESLINTLVLDGYKKNQKEMFYLFLDEFQHYPNLAMIMKNVYDNNDNIKIYASGSSSLSIKNLVQESLAGRKKINEIFPLDFEEFLWFKDDKKLIENFLNAKKLEGENLYDTLKDLNNALLEYMTFGGYPEVVLKTTKEEKIGVFESIFDLYVKKDLVDYFKMDKLLNVKKIIEFLAVNNGQKIKFEEISTLSSTKVSEIKQYIEVLKETYLISILKPFYKNKNKELVKIPKIYFLDNGVRNFFINNFNALSLRSDAGFLFEGAVLNELIKAGFKDIKFWQDKNRNEVDIIIDKISTQIPIEVKFKKILKSDDLKGVKVFLENYKNIKKAYILNIGVQKKQESVELLLFYKLNTYFSDS